MRMRARPYLHCAPVPGGVYFSGARAQFVLKGWDGLFKVADVCVPLLERGTTEDELVAALGTERARPVVRRLTGGLREHGMLLDEDVLSGAGPSDEDRERYAGSLAYLESVCADPYAVFAGVRAARVALFGPPDAVRPASRGLDRAGVGQVLTPDVAEFGEVDAVLWCGTDEELRAGGFGIHSAGRIPDGVPVVPVVLDDRVLQAGPVVRDAGGYPVLSAVRGRVLGWARGEGLGPAARPVADAMIGAIAGQLMFDVLAGIEEGGATHVVHGAELVAERVLLGAADTVDEEPRTLDDAPAEPLPDPDEAIERVNALTARWKGLFTPARTEQILPQMPLAVREMESRTDTPGRITVWAPDQRSATVGAALEALRRSGTTAEGETAAAGQTVERWLLDGVLRLLADEAEPAHKAPVESEETARIRRILQDRQPEPLTVRLLHVPGLDWRLARVELTDGDEDLGAAWAPDGDTAVREALSTALARAQVNATRGAGAGVPALRTDSVNSADEEEIRSLREQAGRLAAARRVRYAGRPLRADLALGEIPFWAGPVRARQLTQEPRHAR
ncbi:hypothetical protein [Streptomyces sp. NBC_01236]|uniref:hypothetical protein n=1 Tax=Streptomyces sp. NBC_01236 TaxID=2903789 RepID=UPI002E11C17F|nr:hypothetical protein OG324_27005 [Streptomyces sp. NBC_01236]